MTTPMVRLSASVPKYVIDEADEIASANNISRSQLISECLIDMIKQQRKKLLAEGYKAMAKEHSEFASLTEDAAKEALSN